MKKTLSLLLALVMIFGLAATSAMADEPATEEDALVVDTCILLEADDAMINNCWLSTPRHPSSMPTATQLRMWS